MQGVMEFFNPLELPCDDFQFFTHGGMVFLFSTSIIFTFVSYPPLTSSISVSIEMLRTRVPEKCAWNY